ncbi:unnamed protein product [Caretta caretta]
MNEIFKSYPFANYNLIKQQTLSHYDNKIGVDNNSLLEDVGFKASFREFWLAWRGQQRAFPSARRWWDVGKVRARLFCRDYTWGTTWRRDVVIGQLEREVLELERRLASSPEDLPLRAAYWEKREELQALEDCRAWGAFVRFCIRLLREMDRGSRYFYALEKEKPSRKPSVACPLTNLWAWTG